jgi:tetratricopeptide (TPR) repeat protein
VKYYTKQLEIMYYESEGKIELTREVCYELLEIVTQNKSVYRKQRLAIVYDYLSNCDMRLGNYKQAINHAQVAQKYFLKNTANYYTAVDHEFLANFYESDLERSKVLCSLLLRSTKKEMGDFKYAKLLFYQANVFFMQKKYKEALKLLNYKLKLSKDKQGWDVSIRILKIQTLIELGRTDEASAHVISLIKHTERAFADQELKPREKVIIRTLRMLQNAGFISAKIKPKLEQFASQLVYSKNFKWEALSPELIPFEKWLSVFYKLKVKQLESVLEDK